jgi:histidinol-phosphate aminotransferase
LSTLERTILTVGPNVSRLIPYSPGKPIDEVKRELGLSNVVKLASNENNLGPSPLALAAIEAAASGLHLYPDAASFGLREALAGHLGVPGDHLVFGNGSDEIIHMIGLAFMLPGDTLMQGEPSFVRYEASAILNGCECVKVPLSDWTHDLDAMADQIDPTTRLIYIANPNNPTGTIVNDAQVRRFLRRLPDRVVVVFDEAYFEFVESDLYPDSRELIREGHNVIALRTFSKAYGLAGLRIGYGIARPEIIRYLEQVREPFNTSLLAQAAGIAALSDTAHLEATRGNNREGKRLLYEGFRNLGLDFTPSDANFVWADLKRDTAPIFEALLRKGVIVRAGVHVGSKTHLRVTIGLPDENIRFLEALEQVLADLSS